MAGALEGHPIDTNTGELAPTVERARAYADLAKAPNTLRAYNADWRDFAAWCGAAHLAPMPADPETVALYLGDLERFPEVLAVTRGSRRRGRSRRRPRR